MYLKIKITAIAFFFFLVAPSAMSYYSADRPVDHAFLQKQVQEYAKKLMAKKNIKGISIALVDRQTLVFAEGYGWADEKKGISASAETVYQTGAISRIFTALAVMRLWEQGRINLDSPIDRYLPEIGFKSRFKNTKPVTVRTLLTQHSGLPSDILKNMYTKNAPVPFPDYMNLTLANLREEYLCAPPDTMYAYSNLGFTLLGYLVQKISGKSFMEYTDHELLSAMEMHHASFSSEKAHTFLAKGYRDGKETQLLKVNCMPAASLYSSALDLSNFIKTVLSDGVFMEKKIVKQGTMKAMIAPQKPGSPYDFDFQVGLGWQLDGYELLYDEKLRYGGRVVWQGGSTILNSAALFILPEARLGVAVLGNSAGSLIETGNIALRCLNLALEMKEGGIISDKKDEPSPEVKLSREQVKSVEGHYSSEYIGFISIKEKEGRLLMEAMGHEVSLLAHADGSFTLKYYLLGFIPVNIELLSGIRFRIEKIQDKKVIVLLKNRKKYLGGIMIERPGLTPGWLSRAGEYKVVSPGDDALLFEDPSIIVAEGFLVFKTRPSYQKNLTIMLPLQPVSDTECVIMGLGRNMGQTMKFIHGNGQTLLAYSGLILKKGR